MNAKITSQTIKTDYLRYSLKELASRKAIRSAFQTIGICETSVQWLEYLQTKYELREMRKA